MSYDTELETIDQAGDSLDADEVADEVADETVALKIKRSDFRGPIRRAL